MNTPFSPQNSGDFRPNPISPKSGEPRNSKLNKAPTSSGDFRPRVAVPSPPKESVTPLAEEDLDEKGHPAQQTVPKESSSRTGKSTPPVEPQKTPKSSSPTLPRTPSKPSASA